MVSDRVCETAWALMHLDVKTSPPKILGIRTYSSDSITLMGSQRTLVVMVGFGKTYQEGIDHIVKQMDENPYYAWVKPLFKRR